VRNNWLNYPTSTQQKLAALGWQPPRPAIEYFPDGSTRVLVNNNSGEDFLYMHRDMIARVNAILAQAGDPNYRKITGWTSIPAPGDPDFPVPPAWDPSLQKVKSDGYYQTTIEKWETTFKDPNFLKKVTLGQLGASLEFNIHNDLHMRWAADPGAYRPAADPTQADATISTDWDNPVYNYLGDTYSSHVNSLFWKVHGWVDNRIEDWKAANNISGDINWTGTWIGHMEAGTMPMGHMMLAKLTEPGFMQNMEQVSRIIAQSGIFLTPFRLDLRVDLNSLS
jgi:hypothetical protein